MKLVCPQDSDSPLARVAVSFSYHDDECDTRNGSCERSEDDSRQSGNAFEPAGRILDCRYGAQRRSRRRVCLRCLHDRSVLPSIVSGAPSAPRKRGILPPSRSGGKSRLSRLPALPPKIAERKSTVG